MFVAKALLYTNRNMNLVFKIKMNLVFRISEDGSEIELLYTLRDT